MIALMRRLADLLVAGGSKWVSWLCNTVGSLFHKIQFKAVVILDSAEQDWLTWISQSSKKLSLVAYGWLRGRAVTVDR